MNIEPANGADSTPAADAGRDHATRTARSMMAGRIWGGICAPLQMLVTAHFLTPAEQGFAYTMASMLGVATLFELGLGQVLVIILSHHAIGCRIDAQGIHGPAERTAAIARLAGTACSGIRWAAGAFVVAVGVAGWRLFSIHGEAAAWHGPWIAVLLVTAVGLILGPLLAAFESLGDLGSLARLRFRCGVLSTAVSITALLAGLGLWSVVLAPAASWGLQIFWLLCRRQAATAALLGQRPSWVAWRQEVWPLQWRFAVSWIGGYIIFQAVVPLAFARLGPADAGRVGMSLAIGWSLIGLASIWINASTPEFGRWAAQDLHGLIRDRFRWAIWRGLATGAALVVLAVVGAWAAARLGWVLAERVLPWPLLAVVLLTALSHVAQSGMAVVLRSYRQEPLMWLTVAEAILLAALLPAVARPGALAELMLIYGGIHGVLALAMVCIIYRRRMVSRTTVGCQR